MEMKHKAKMGKGQRVAWTFAWLMVAGVVVVLIAAAYSIGKDQGGRDAKAAVSPEPARPTLTVTSVTTLPAPAANVAQAPGPTAKPTEFSDGTYLVGEDMPVGTYVANGDMCYWARHKNEANAPGQIVDNHLGSGQSVFPAKKGEFVEIARCTFRKK